MAKGIERIFIGWERPLLHALRDWLHARLGPTPRRIGAALDFSAFTIILPGARAGRRLVELLVTGADNAIVIPPRVMTLGAWSALGSGSGGVIAGPMARLAAWVTALRGLSEQQRCAICAMNDDADPADGWERGVRWLGVARLIDECHAELCAEGLRFDDVPRRAADVAGFADAERWEALAAAQLQYERILRGAGVVDAGLALMESVERGTIDADALTGPDAADAAVVFAGISEMSALTRRLIDHIADRSVALVPAPHTMRDRFDDYGCVIPHKWDGVRIDIPEQSVIAGEGPDEQAAAALREIERLSLSRAKGLPPDQVTLGVPDPEVERRLTRLAGRLSGVAVRRAEGTPVIHTRPVKLLLAIAAYLELRDFRSFAALVRHPDLERWIDNRRGKGEWSWRGRRLTVLDEYQQAHLHGVVNGAWLTEHETERAVLDTLYRGVEDLLAGSEPGASLLDKGRREPSVWCVSVWDVIRNVYARRRFPPGKRARKAPDNDATPGLFDDIEHDAADARLDEITREACFAIQARLAELAALPTELAAALRLTPAETIRLVLGAAGDDAIPEPGDEAAIDMVGWLELAADDAQWVIVTGMNEGVVPSSPGADPLIPEALRRALALRDRHARLARDAFLMLRIIHSRPDGRALFIFGRRSAEGDPLAPSRLLLAGDGASLQSRVRLWAGGKGGPPESALMLTPGGRSRFSVEPERLTSRVPAQPIEVMSVTSFRHYIESPLAFYLRYVLKLGEPDDAAVELDPMGFGNLLHDVLCKLVDPELSACRDAQRIYAYLSSQLDSTASLRFGDEPRAEVWVQVEQAKMRLEAFAHAQARRAAEGWRIVRTEWKAPDRAARLMVDGTPMYLSGRIDRIDVNERDGAWAILDYKTSGKKPDKTTARTADGVWKDPQLPLYRHLVRPLLPELGLSGEPRLGWVALPNAAEDTSFVHADWSTDELAAADDVLAQIVRDIRAGKFADQGDKPPADGVLGWLCGGLETEELEPGEEADQ